MKQSIFEIYAAETLRKYFCKIVLFIAKFELPFFIS